MDYSFYPYFAVIGFIVAVIALKIGIFIAPKVGLVDKPGGRKSHDHPVPLIGGLVIVPVFAGLVYASGLDQQTLLAALLGGVVLLLLIGALDDMVAIHPWARFVIQIWLACYVVIFCDANIGNLGNLFGFGEIAMWEWFGKIFSVTCLVLIMNAVNMLDGLDGLGAGFITVALGWLAFASVQAGAMLIFWAILFLIVPVMAFWIFNVRFAPTAKAKAFLGDAGSLSLALILGWFAIQAAKGPDALVPPVSIIWIMSLPIIDTFALFFTRKKLGRSPFSADRLHIHYQLQDHGVEPHWITPFLLTLALATGAVGVLGPMLGVADYVLLYSWSTLLLIYTYYRVKTEMRKTRKKT